MTAGQCKKEDQRRDSQKGKNQRRKKTQRHEMLKTPREAVFFRMFRASRGSKSRLAKTAGVESSGEMSGPKVSRREAF